LLNSKNQHGIHSPFVYQWVTQCLYADPKLEKTKATGVVLKSIAHFGHRSVRSGGNKEILEKIQQNFPNTNFEVTPIDLLVIEKADWRYLENLMEQDILHNDSMILIVNIHTNREQEKLWNVLAKKEQFTVSADLFYCGVLFLRKEQKKEHFNIRI